MKRILFIIVLFVPWVWVGFSQPAPPSYFYQMAPGLNITYGGGYFRFYTWNDTAHMVSNKPYIKFNGHLLYPDNWVSDSAAYASKLYARQLAHDTMLANSPGYLKGADTANLSARIDSLAEHGGGEPGGADTYLQYDSANVFSGNNGLVYDYTNKYLKLFNIRFNQDNNGVISFGARSTSTNYGAQIQIKAQQAKSGATDANGGTLALFGGNPTGAGVSQITFSTYGGGASGTTDRSVAQKATLYGDGYFGIGLTAPTDYLHIKSGSTTVGQIHLNKSPAACNDTGTIQRTARELHLTDDTAKVQDLMMAAYGEMFLYSPSSTSYSDAASYTAVTGLSAGSALKYTSFIGDSALKVLSGGDGVYKVTWKIGWSSTYDSSPLLISGMIYINNTAQTNTYGRNVRGWEDVSTISGQGLITLNTNDVVKLKYTFSGEDLSFTSVNVIIERIDRN